MVRAIPMGKGKNVVPFMTRCLRLGESRFVQHTKSDSTELTKT